MESAVSVMLAASLVAGFVTLDLKPGQLLRIHAQRVPLRGKAHQLQKFVSRHEEAHSQLDFEAVIRQGLLLAVLGRPVDGMV